jgi:hypothetical protein
MSGIYFVQPDILDTTDFYKFGRSDNVDERVESYGVERKEYIKIYVDDIKTYEQNLKYIFKSFRWKRVEYIKHKDVNSLTKIFMTVHDKTKKVLNFLNMKVIYKRIQSNLKNEIIFMKNDNSNTQKLKTIFIFMLLQHVKKNKTSNLINYEREWQYFYNNVVKNNTNNTQKLIINNNTNNTQKLITNNNTEDIETVKNKNATKNINKFICECCNYSTSVKCNLDVHFKSNKHKKALGTINIVKNNEENTIENTIENDDVNTIKNDNTNVVENDNDNDVVNDNDIVNDTNNDVVNLHNKNISVVKKCITFGGFICKHCDYSTKKKGNLQIHFNSIKHKKATKHITDYENQIIKISRSVNKYICYDCGKEHKKSKDLCNHRARACKKVKKL